MTALAVTLKNWFFTRNSMILTSNVLLFAILFNTLPFDPQSRNWLVYFDFRSCTLVNGSNPCEHHGSFDPATRGIFGGL